MSTRRLRYFFAACLLLVVASCFDGRSQAIEPTETSLAAPTGNTAMPATLRMAFLRAQQKAAGYDFQSDAAGTLQSQAGVYGATAAVAATPRGVRLSSDDDGLDLGIETTSIGRDGAASSRTVLGRRAEGQELVLDRADDVEERYLAGPLGLEQSWVLRERPAGNGLLAIDVAFEGLAPEVTGGRVLLRDDAGLVRAGYGDLVAADAEGRELSARMEAREGGVGLVIDDAGATYPVRVDPMVWTQQAELAASDGAASDLFGFSVSVSGSTALVGAPDHQVGMNFRQGAAYVFVQNGTTWTQQAELTASDGAANDTFGCAVSLSGGTALVGSPDPGVAYVFVQNGSTWTQQAELAASDGAAFQTAFGNSVSVSGGTALVGAWGHRFGASDYQGAAYVFVQIGTAWTQQAELIASDGAMGDAFGASLSVSGGTAVVGAPGHQVGANYGQGAAYVFVQSGTTWTQEAELTASDGAAGDAFGQAVSVSGGTALVGAPGFQPGPSADDGAAYVFVQSGSTWTQEAELTASDSAAGDGFGWSVSGSCGTALVGALDHQVEANAEQGAAYVFINGCATGTGSTTSSSSASGGTTSSSSASGGTTGSGGGGGGGEGGGIVIGGCGCRVAGEPTPDEGSLLATVTAMAMLVGLRRPRTR